MKAHLEMTSLAPGWPVYNPHSAGPAQRAGDWHKKLPKMEIQRPYGRNVCGWSVQHVLGTGEEMFSPAFFPGWALGQAWPRGQRERTLLENGPEKCLCALRTGKRIPPLQFMKRNR